MSAGPLLPDGLRIYAIGDVHGRFDLLQALYDRIRKFHERRPARTVEILLGDYIDRGPQSREVVEWLVRSPPIADERVCLMGNHEALLLDALVAPEALPDWLQNGGVATLASYGLTAATLPAGIGLEELRVAVLRALPPEHRTFLEGLSLTVRFGRYLFVHAGIRPGRPLAEQDPQDLIWIRETFHRSNADFGCIVVHGHTPVDEPEIRPNRINIDTGAVFTDRLTCLVLEGETRRFVHT